VARKKDLLQQDILALEEARRKGEAEMTAEELIRETESFMANDPFLAAEQAGGEVVTAHFFSGECDDSDFTDLEDFDF
jgi:hypothetical protein